MPLYDFSCPKCGLDFTVSRPISRATEPALCPMDSEPADRVFTMPMTYVKGGAGLPSPPKAPPSAGGGTWSHFGHSHGPGSGSHSHGTPYGA
jgi:putative FmdB family regulatory protein